MMEGRNPRNLQGLLRFAMELTASEDAPHESQFAEMDEERRKFLEEVINSMTVNVVEEFEKAIQTLKSETSSDEEKTNALESIQEFVDHIDNANNFVKLGGDTVILDCLSSKNVNIRNSAATMIAEMCQNNPFCQEKFGSDKVFEKLICLLNDNEVAVNSMHAISCLTRHYEPSLSTFVRIGGLECLLACVASSIEKVSIKSCFLIAALSSEFQNIREKLIQMGAVERLAACVKPVYTFETRIESILAALSALMEPSEIKFDLQKIPLESVLEDMLKKTKDKPECEEIRQYCHSILNSLASRVKNVDAAER